MFANVLLTKANHMVKSRVKVGRTTELQGKGYNSARPLTGAIGTASLCQVSVPKVFSSAALLYLPPSWSCWMSCFPGSQPSSSRALCCLGSHSPLAGGTTSWFSHPGSAQVDFWVSLSRLSLPFMELKKALPAENLFTVATVSEAVLVPRPLTGNPKPRGIYQLALTFKSFLPRDICQEEAR